MKAIDKIIEDLQLNDIKRLGGKLNKEILITKPLSKKSKLEYLYDKNGKLLYKRKINNDKEEFKNSYKYNKGDDSNTIIYITKKCYNYKNGEFDTFTSNMITTNKCITDGKEILNICDYRSNYRTNTQMAYRTFYNYEKIKIDGLELNVLLSIDSSDVYHKDSNGEFIIERLLQLDDNDYNINNNYITLNYSYPDGIKSNVIINITDNRITSMKCITNDEVKFIIYISYTKDGFLSETKKSLITHSNWEYSTSTKYNYKDMIIEEKLDAKKL